MADVDAWMPIWIGDYLADTQDLTTGEHGAYMLLLMTAWRNRGRLPAAPERLARIAKMNLKTWPETWKVLARFFQVDGEELVQRRLLRELEEATAKRTTATERGRKGALARHANGKAVTPAQGVLKQCSSSAQAEPELKPSPSPSPSQEENPAPARARDPWAGWQWFEKFKVAWPIAHGRIAYGSSDEDSRASGDLEDKLNSLPGDDRLKAEEAAAELFARYFGIKAAAGHPWKWFVQRFNELRVGPIAARSPPRGALDHKVTIQAVNDFAGGT